MAACSLLRKLCAAPGRHTVSPSLLDYAALPRAGLSIRGAALLLRLRRRNPRRSFGDTSSGLRTRRRLRATVCVRGAEPHAPLASFLSRRIPGRFAIWNPLKIKLLAALAHVESPASDITPSRTPFPSPLSEELRPTQRHLTKGRLPMRHLLQYRPRMQSRASLALFLILAFALAASAQINGAPASVTSYGFGGHAYPNAPRASVTSLG